MINLKNCVLIGGKLNVTFPQVHSKISYEGALVKIWDYLFGRLCLIGNVA